MKILVAFDGSHISEDALEYALDHYGRSGSEVTVAHVAVPELEWGGFYEGWEEAAERGEAILERAEEMAEDHDLKIETTLLEGNPADAVAEFADGNGFDAVVVGHRGTTDRRRKLLGSVAEELMERVETNVVVVNPRRRARQRS